MEREAGGMEREWVGWGGIPERKKLGKKERILSFAVDSLSMAPWHKIETALRNSVFEELSNMVKQDY